MNKILITISTIIVIICGCFFLFNTKNKKETLNTDNSNIDVSSVIYNGWLHTDGSKLKNQKNEIIQLRGVSSHGIEWFYDLITYDNLYKLKNEWNTNVFRIAMYTDSNGQGYISNSNENKNKVYNIIDMACKLDMYVIVDWHILNDNNPQIYKSESLLFFDDISKKYSDIPNVIYEICNEPNGYDVTWDKDVKPYAEDIISTIRENSNKSLIIVGTPDWCKNLKSAADNPLNYNNVVYSCHFYSGTHKAELREQISYCINKNIPIFVSECGVTQAYGDGEVYFDEFSTWIDFLNSNNISWIYWSFSNKNESSAILRPDYNIVNFNNTQSSKFYNNTTDTNNTNNANKLNNTYNSNNINDIKNSNNITNINNNFSDNEYTNNNDYNNSNLNDSYNSIDFNEYLTNSGVFIKNIFLSYKK